MSWLVRVYEGSPPSSRYECENHRRFPLPKVVTLTKPWTSRISAQFVLSNYGQKDTITGLRLARLPKGKTIHNATAYIGDLIVDGHKRLLVAVQLNDDKSLFLVGIHSGMPLKRRDATLAAIVLLRHEYRQHQQVTLND